MESKKTASKSSSKAKLNLNVGLSKKTTKKVEKKIKRTSKATLLFCLIAIVVGFVVGIVLFNVICKDDCFEIIGSDEITLTLDEKYVDSGVKIIEFGKDISDQVQIETNLPVDNEGFSSEIGTFYVKYSVDSIKYGKIFKIEKIKLISFVESSEGGE